MIRLHQKKDQIQRKKKIDNQKVKKKIIKKVIRNINELKKETAKEDFWNQIKEIQIQNQNQNQNIKVNKRVKIKVQREEEEDPPRANLITQNLKIKDNPNLKTRKIKIMK